jgi:methylthioribose-1-phosphate isomerase
MRAAELGLDEHAAGDAVAAALRAEADAIATEATATEAVLASRLESVLPRPEGRPLTLLLHGGQGPLIAGQLGATLAALGRWREAGRELAVYLTEGRPFMDGARLAAWELRQAGIEHRIVPDLAAAWLFEQEAVDAVVVRGEWVAANGDCGTPLGGRALAQLARAAGGRGQRPSVLVLAPAAAMDAETADGSAIPTELRPARELGAFLADTPIRPADALVPAADVIPAELIDALVSEPELGD